MKGIVRMTPVVENMPVMRGKMRVVKENETA